MVNAATAEEIAQTEFCYAYANTVNEVKKLRVKGVSKDDVKKAMKMHLNQMDLGSNKFERESSVMLLMTALTVGELAYKHNLPPRTEDEEARKACGEYSKAMDFLPEGLK